MTTPSAPDPVSEELFEKCRKAYFSNYEHMERPEYAHLQSLRAALRVCYRQAMLDAAKLSAQGLAKAWARYAEFFGEVPHGTEKQMAALLELIPKELTARAKL